MSPVRALQSASLFALVAACATAAHVPNATTAAPRASAGSARTGAPVAGETDAQQNRQWAEKTAEYPAGKAEEEEKTAEYPAGEAKETIMPPRACGALDCLAFATPGAAFDYVLSGEPRVLAVGEAHAQASTPGIASSTRRFAEQLLPKLVGKSRHLVIELLLSHCAVKTEHAVEAEQAPVTEQQAKGNQNEFVTLGKVAQRLGIEPQGLTPACSEYDAAVASPDGGVAGLLRLIASQTETQVRALLRKESPSSDLIVTYGGALHNDLHPRPGQEAWSFGPKLAAETNNRYLELDLIVPEFVKDSEAWRNLPWFSVFDRRHLRSDTLLYRPAQGSFVLIFPKTEPAAADAR